MYGDKLTPEDEARIAKDQVALVVGVPVAFFVFLCLVGLILGR